MSGTRRQTCGRRRRPRVTTARLRTFATRYAIVVLAVAAATVVRAALWPALGPEAPFSVHWIAIVFIAWYAGATAGIVTTVLSTAAVEYLLFGPFYDPDLVTRPPLVVASVFTGLGVGVSLFVGWIQLTARRSAGLARRAAGQRSRLQLILKAEREALGRAVLEVERRRRAEDALHHSEEQYRLLAEAVPQMVWMALPDGHVEYFNSRWREYTGLLQDQSLGSAWEEVIHPDDRPAAMSAWQAALATGDACEIEYRLRRHDGDYRWHIARALPVRDDDGEVIRWVGTNTDLHDQKTTQAELRQANERFRLAAEAVTAVIYDWDPLTNRVERTRGLADLLGFAPDEAESTNAWWRQRIHPDDRERFVEKWQEVLVQGDRYEFEYRLLHKDGRALHAIDRGAIVRDDSGRLVRVVGSVQDITTRVRMETALRANETRFRFLAEGGEALAASLDYEATLRTVARLAVPALADFAVVHLAVDDDAKLVAVAHTDATRQIELEEIGQGYSPAANRRSLIMQVLRTGAAVLVPDVTDDYLRMVVPIGTIAKGFHSLGIRSWIVVPLRARDRTLGVVSLFTAESGRRFEAADLALAEELAGRAALALDNARLYREAREADRRKDEFLAMLGHELRNPLAPIVTALHMFGRSKGLDEAATAARDMIDRQVRHLTRLVDDLLDVARITRGKVKLHRHPIELKTVLTTAIETARPLLDARRHDLTVTLPDGPVWLNADAARLTQVFGNLLTNAAKYMEDGGTVEIEASRSSGPSPSASEESSLALGLGSNLPDIIIRVRDRGVGIPAEMLPRVFDLFTQVGSALDRAQGGLGIGLSLVRSLVELHNGRVEAHSAGPGRGSEFTVRLPTIPTPVEQPRPAVPFVAQTNGHAAPASGVLITDDNRDAADSLALLLQAWGYRTWVAYDGPTALATAAKHRPRVMLLDIGLGGMTGYDVARQLRANDMHAGARLIALTGFGQEDDRRRSAEAGFDAHVVKPVDPEELQRLLAEATTQN
jgi:PAS domain S-box-containing protein